MWKDLVRTRQNPWKTVDEEISQKLKKKKKKKKWMLHSLSLSFSIPAESPLPKSLHGAASVLRRCRMKYSSLAFRNGARGPLSQGAYDNQVWSFMVQINSAGLYISQILNWNDINLLCHINSYRMKSMEIPRRYNISWFVDIYIFNCSLSILGLPFSLFLPSQPEVPHRQPGGPRPQVTKRLRYREKGHMEGPHP